MAKQRKKLRIVILFLLFIAYFIAAARPIPKETILAPKWLSSLESGVPISLGRVQVREQFTPFILGYRFGYIDPYGNFTINNLKTGYIYLSENLWTEYDAEPVNIEIKNIDSEIILNIENPRGYPILLDKRIFILGTEQNALSEIDINGNVLWTYEFGAPITCIDAAAGLVLIGSVDGIIEILDSNGRRIFYFEPGGSRFSVILGCAISSDGSRIGIISGIDQQRFLMLERFGSSGGDYRVVYHEFLGSDFRRPVYISFIDEDRRIVFESYQGIGCYNVKYRRTIRIPLEGTIAAIDTSGSQGFFFLINSLSGQQKEFVGIRFPQDSWLAGFRAGHDMRDAIFVRAPFKSDDVFLGRNGSMIIAGGGTTLISFALEEK